MVLSRAGVGATCLFLCLVIAVVLAVVPAADAREPIRIAMITAKTGEAGKSNKISFDGARFAVDQINRDGGVLGRRVKLLEYDNHSTPEGSVEAARKALKDGAVAVVGCNWSSHSLAMAKVLQEARVPMISHMSTNEAVTRVGNYIFRSCFTDAFQGLGIARFARDRLGCKTAIILVDQDRAYSRGLAQTFAGAFSRLGGRVLLTANYHGNTQVDFREYVREVVRMNPDALFVPGGYKDGSVIFGLARNEGYSGYRLSGDGIGIKMYDYIGSRADGIYFSSHWSRWVDTKKSKEFVRSFEAKVRPALEDTYVEVYDSFMLLVDAIRRAGSTEGSKIRDALAKTSGFEGVTGVIHFDENGDPIKPMVINQLKFGGMLYVEQIYP